MMPTCTIKAFTAGILYRVTLVATGPSTATCQTQEWKPGSNPAAEPDSDSTVSLTNCRASADGSILLAQTKYLMLTPDVTLTLSEAPGVEGAPDDDEATIEISHAWPANSKTSHRISADDLDMARGWVVAAGFPGL